MSRDLCWGDILLVTEVESSIRQVRAWRLPGHRWRSDVEAENDHGDYRVQATGIDGCCCGELDSTLRDIPFVCLVIQATRCSGSTEQDCNRSEQQIAGRTYPQCHA